jgi:hypothetical protein
MKRSLKDIRERLDYGRARYEAAKDEVASCEKEILNFSKKTNSRRGLTGVQAQRECQTGIPEGV